MVDRLPLALRASRDRVLYAVEAERPDVADHVRQWLDALWGVKRETRYMACWASLVAASYGREWRTFCEAVNA